jgi:hypothetical protein
MDKQSKSKYISEALYIDYGGAWKLGEMPPIILLGESSGKTAQEAEDNARKEFPKTNKVTVWEKIPKRENEFVWTAIN